jgi:hypothetical protein
MMHSDSYLPNEEQRRKLSEMLHSALTEIRAHALAGRAEQAADLADAFHNLPKDMWCDHFSIQDFREAFLEPYHRKWPKLFD